MKVAALQMVSTPDVARNLDAAARLVARAAADGARLAVLPEYFCIMGMKDRDKLAVAERDGSGPIQDRLAGLAREHAIWLVGGTLPLVDDAAPGERVRNASLAFAPDGARVARYDKLHLFRFDNGRESYDEGRVLTAGTTPVAFDAEGLRIGMSVCYDLRFPELYRALMRPTPCDVLLVPSAFTVPTGKAHWELLLRARAVENQAYVVAAAQGGRHENGRSTHGHSCIVDPWGDVVAMQDVGEGVVGAVVDRERLATVRRELPALEHRRTFA